jgi:hypothetical protein
LASPTSRCRLVKSSRISFQVAQPTHLMCDSFVSDAECVQLVKNTIFWDVTPCILVMFGDISEERTLSFTESSVNSNQTTRCHISEDRSLHSNCCDVKRDAVGYCLVVWLMMSSVLLQSAAALKCISVPLSCSECYPSSKFQLLYTVT